MLDLWLSRWPNFKPPEVLSPVGLELFEKGVLVMNFDHLYRIQTFRRNVQLPLYCNTGEHRLRGFRSYAENLRVGGKLYHTLGLATDVSSTIPPAELAEKAEKFGFTGIGLYDTFIHLDSRPCLDGHVARWDFRSKK